MLIVYKKSYFCDKMMVFVWRCWLNRSTIVVVQNRNVKNKTPRSLQGVGLEQVAGIEPANYAWEAYILPLNYTCMIE